MESCVNLSGEHFLKVYPCFNTICQGIKPAAKLLSGLLYLCNLNKDTDCKKDLTNQELAKRDQTIKAPKITQSELVKDCLCDEITEKTLHDTAIPTLYLLGFLDVDMSSTPATYTVYVDRVQLAINLHNCPVKLEKFLIQIVRFSLENKKNFQLNKKNFQLELEKFLIGIRKISNGKRGRKPTPEAGSEGIFSPPKNNKEYIRIEEDITAQSPNGSVLNVSSPSPVYTQEDEPTLPTRLQQTLENFTPRRSNSRPSDPPKEGKNTPPKQASKQAVDPTELERVKSACEKAVGSRFMWIPEELRYAKTLAEGHATDEEIGMVVQRLKKTWSKDNITAKTICIHFGNQLSQAALSIPADTSTQQEEDRISRYNDPNFDPYTLSFPEYAAWTEWKKQHQPVPVLA